VLQDLPVYTNSYTVTGLASNTTYYYRVRASTEYDTDAQAFFTRVTTAGGSLTTTEQQATNALVLNLKYYSLWSKMKAIYPMVGASAAACAQNLKSSSFTGTFNGGWTFASTGVTPNGSTGYMSTGIIPSTNLSISSAHLSSYNNTNPNDGVLLGANALNCFLQYSTGQLYGGLANTTFINTTASQTASFVMVNRPSSSTLNLFRNNSKILQNTSNTGSSYTSNALELARYGSSFYQDARFAFASIGDGLTDTEASNFYTSVQAFQTTLSRNV
jgi:hypothetical protein